MFGLSSSKQVPDTASVLIYTTIPPAGCEQRGYEKLLFCFHVTVF